MHLHTVIEESLMQGAIMSIVRDVNNPIILKLLQKHDALSLSQYELRNALQRRILFLMTTIKLYELELERNHRSESLQSTRKQSDLISKFAFEGSEPNCNHS